MTREIERNERAPDSPIQLDALQLDFALTHYLLGKKAFQKLAHNFLKKEIALSPNKNEISKAFSAFVATDDISKEHLCLTDSVTMEWLAIESLATTPPIGFTGETLACLSEEDWSRVAFKLNDSIRLMNSIWPLDKLWILRDTKSLESMSFRITEYPQGFVLYQLRGSIHVKPISGFEFDALELLSQHIPLSSVMDRMSLRYPTMDLSAEIGPLFGKWIAQNFIQEILL